MSMLLSLYYKGQHFLQLFVMCGPLTKDGGNMEIRYVERALKMPHTQVVGYYFVDGEKIYTSIKDSKIYYFNTKQKEIVEKNKEKLATGKFIELPRAVVKESELVLGDIVIECGVLNDGRRIIKDQSLFSAIGKIRKGEVRVEGFPAIIGSKAIANLYLEMYGKDISLIDRFEVAEYTGRAGLWYDCSAIPILCDLYMEADKRGCISQGQQHILERTKILLRSLAKVGIMALIDEATNYQEERGRDELQTLLAKFITEDLQNYSNEFPAEYFENLFRLYGIPYDPTTSRRPRFFAQFNLKYAYNMLVPNAIEVFDKYNPTIYNEAKDRYDRKYRIYRNLTEDGIKELREHLKILVTVMKISTDIENFKTNFNIAFSNKIESLEALKSQYNPEDDN